MLEPDNEFNNACSYRAPMVTLADGRQVKSDSREWLLECGARYILNQPTKPDRYRILDGIEAKQGLAARQAMEVLIKDLWRLRRNAA
jgi:hypothetical protein